MLPTPTLPTVPLRRLLHVPRHAVRLGFALAVALGLVFVGLTRTQVGRDGLRQQIERSFDDRFDGRVEIGRLDGNLVRDLYATGVRLYDAEGRLVVSVDSVIAEPHWRSLLRRGFDARSLTLVRPSIRLHQNSSGAWTAGSAFRRSDTLRVLGARKPFSLTLATLRLEEATLVVESDAPPSDAIASGRLFDYRALRLDSLDATLTIEQGGGRRLVDLVHLNARAPGLDFRVDEMRAQFDLHDDTLAVTALRLATPSSDLRLQGRLAGLSHLRGEAPGAPVLDLDFSAEPLDLAEVRRFLPSLPLNDEAALTLRASGPLDDLAVETARASSRAAFVEAEGRVTGLPSRLGVDARVRGRWIRSDVRRLFPTLRLPTALALDTARVDVTVRAPVARAPSAAASSGFALPPRLRASGVVTTPRSGTATLEVTAERQNRSLTYEGSLVAEALRPRRVWRNAPRGLVTLSARAEGRLGSGHAAGHEVQLLSASGQVAGRAFSSARGTLALRSGTLASEGTVTLAGRGGSVAFDGIIDGLGQPSAALTHRIALRTSALDMAALLPRPDSLHSAFDAALGWTGTGSSGADLTGVLVLDTRRSSLQSDAQVSVIPSHRIRLDLATGSAPHAEVSGDVIAGTLALSAPLSDAEAALAAWTPHLRQQFGALLAPRENASSSSDTLSARSNASDISPAAPAVTATGALRVLRSDILGAYIPALPRLGTDAAIALRIDADAARFRAEGSLRADSLVVTAPDSTTHARAHGLALDMSASLAATSAPGADRSARLVAAADSARALANTIFAPGVTLRLDGAGGEFSVTSAPPAGETQPPLLLDATLALGGGAARVRIQRLDLRTGIYAWRQSEPAALTLFRDAVAVERFALVSRPAGLVTSLAAGIDPQRFMMRGIASAQATDTLALDFDRVALRPLVGLTRFRRAVGGQLDADIDIAAALGRREIAGSLHAQTLSLDDVVLGDLSARADFDPARDAIAVSLGLTPPALDIRPDTPGRALITTSRLKASGTVTPTSSGTALGLRVDAPDLDLGLLTLLFPTVIGEVDGFAQASGTIGGRLGKPSFDISLRGDARSLTIPRFGLEYALAAEVDIVGEEGLRFRSARLTDPRGGTGEIDGWLRFNDYRYFSFDLAGRLDRMTVMNKDRPGDLAFYGDLAASGDLTFTGPTFEPILRSSNAVVTPESELYIPISGVEDFETDRGFVLFADSTGAVPDVDAFTRRRTIVSRRPEGERLFAEALGLDLNIRAPSGATVGLVFDELIGDMLRAEGSGRVQLQKRQGEFTIYGTFDVDGGDYLFTAGDVFAREFEIQDGGSMTWDGNPLNAALDIPAAYRTRASRAGLPSFGGDQQGLIPVVVNLDIGGRVLAPEIDLSLSVDRSDRQQVGSYEEVEVYLNNPDRATEYATSVLLTNTFLLTPNDGAGSSALSQSGTITFSSLSALVSSQLTRILSQAVPNLDVRFGVQQGDRLSQLDLTGGLALYLLDDRLVIRGEGVVSQNDPERRRQEQGLEGEIAVEVRLTDAVAVEVFFRREGDVIADALTSTRGAGLTYQTQFTTWGRFLRRVFGGDDPAPPPPPFPEAALPEERIAPPDSASTSDLQRLMQ